MPKGRHLKPEFFTDKHVVSVTPLARLLYQGLWCYATDCGHLDDEPLELKMRILPADSCDVDELLGELVSVGRIERAGGVIHLPKLGEHARVDKRYETRCDACKQPGNHGVTTTSKGSPSTPGTQGPQRDHSGTTTGPLSDHDADGDGDGDGDGMVKGARKRATQIPDDWKPNDGHTAYAVEQQLSLDIEADQFRDYHRAKGSTMKDWDAAFRTWLRNAVKFRRDQPPISRPRSLPFATDIEQPPDGLSPAEYAEWDRGQREKRRRRA